MRPYKRARCTLVPRLQSRVSLEARRGLEHSETCCRLRCQHRRRFGTENEKLGYNVATTQRATYAEIRQLLEGLASRFGWEPIMEGDLIIGVQMDGQSVTLEPGGQFELSGAPVDTLHKTCAEVNQHLYQVQASCQLPGAVDRA